MKVRFWGVRGSLPTPGRSTVRYGGNTACVEVRLKQRRLILDAGSGLTGLSAVMARDPRPVTADLLLSHVHYDHICGLPFFTPLFHPGNLVRIWSGRLPDGTPGEAALRIAMTPPLMPDMAAMTEAQTQHRDFQAGSVLDFGDGAIVRTTGLRHPGGSVGYRIEWSGKTMVYATDTSHGDPEVDAGLRQLCLGADLLIYDAMLTEAEYPSRAGWGHSTWCEGVRLADACGVGQLVLFHHAPTRDDKAMAALAADAAAARPGTVAAREGLELKVG